MTPSVSRPLHARRLGSLWWLPSGGQGNGLRDAGWAPVLDVPAGIVAPLLEAFRSAGVPAYASPAHTVAARLAARGNAPACRIWVGTKAYGRAEDVLLTVMPVLMPAPGRSRQARA